MYSVIHSMTTMSSRVRAYVPLVDVRLERELASLLRLRATRSAKELSDDLGSIPPFNEDDEGDRTPQSVLDLRHRIGEADALLISTPEYNHSVPVVIKNAMDWASRPAGRSEIVGKPAAVMSASLSTFGGVWAQAELRKSPPPPEPAYTTRVWRSARRRNASRPRATWWIRNSSTRSSDSSRSHAPLRADERRRQSLGLTLLGRRDAFLDLGAPGPQLGKVGGRGDAVVTASRRTARASAPSALDPCEGRACSGGKGHRCEQDGGLHQLRAVSVGCAWISSIRASRRAASAFRDARSPSASCRACWRFAPPSMPRPMNSIISPITIGQARAAIGSSRSLTVAPFEERMRSAL